MKNRARGIHRWLCARARQVQGTWTIKHGINVHIIVYKRRMGRRRSADWEQARLVGSRCKVSTLRERALDLRGAWLIRWTRRRAFKAWRLLNEPAATPRGLLPAKRWPLVFVRPIGFIYIYLSHAHIRANWRLRNFCCVNNYIPFVLRCVLMCLLYNILAAAKIYSRPAVKKQVMHFQWESTSL